MTRETTSTTFELSNLVPYTEYTIWVRAVNENGLGIPTKEITVRTYSAQPSQPPYNVTLEAASSTVSKKKLRFLIFEYLFNCLICDFRV